MPAVTQNAQDNVPGSEDLRAPHYASFILRCRVDTKGKIYARLIDVNSGMSYPVAELAALPEQVRHLVARSLPAPRTDADRS